MGVPISNQTRRVVYAASSTGPYNFSFEILNNTDIAVYRDDTLLTLTTNYTVTINSNGTGSVTLTASPTGATQIAIVGNRTIQRSSDFVTGGDFFANTLNDELDQQTIFAQQNAEGLARALSAPQTDPTTIDMTLPRASERAGKYLSFDSNGDPVAAEGRTEVAGVYAIRDDIVTVADIASDVTAVADNEANVNTVGGISGNVTTVAGIAANVTTVAGISSNVTSVAGNATNINTVAGSISNVNAVGSNITAVTGVNSNATNINTVAGQITPTNNVSTVAGKATEIGTVAGISSAVSTVASNVTAITTNATNITAIQNASSNASSASASASSASSSATAASSSATAAAGSATSASSSASTATTQASAASTSATNAATSATNAANSATAAAGSATTASTQATNAATSATNAASSATSAASAKTAAESARDATLAAFDSFDDRYLGAKSSDPSVDNDGNALAAGALYFSTTAGAMKVYTGSAWVVAYVSGSDFLPLAGGTMGGEIVSAGIKYTPAGTGAVQRSFESKVGESVSVTDFGAVGNGSTEDTTAVQAAINSGAKLIVFPAGKTFLIDQVTSAGTDTTFYAVGSTIKLKANSTIYRPLRINHARCTVIGGTWDGNRANQTAGDAFGSWAIGIHADDCAVYEATIKNFRGSGVKNFGGNRCTVERCRITDIGYSTAATCYGIYMETASGVALYGNTARNNYIALGNEGTLDQPILFTSNSTTGGEAQWDWEISGNNIQGSTNAAQGDGSICLAARGHRGKVIGNTTVGGAMGWSEGGDQTVIQGNTFKSTVGTLRWGIEASGSQMAITGNVVTGHLRAICFSFPDNDDMLIAGNTLESDGTGNHCIAAEIPSGGTGKNLTVVGNMMRGRRGIIATREIQGMNVTGNTFVGPGSGTSGSRFIFIDSPVSAALYASIKDNKISACERAVSVYSASATTFTDIAFTGNNCRDDVAGGVYAHVISEGSAVLGSRIKNFDNEQNASGDNFNMLFDNTNRRGIEYSNSFATPEGNVTAGVGSIYISLASGVRVLWMKSSGTGNTGWAQMLGAASAGTTGQVLTSAGSGALPTWANAATGGLTFDFPYSESITAGDVLQLLTTGEVEKVKVSAVSQTIPSGATVSFGSSSYSSIKFDPNNANRFVVVYRDNSNGAYGTARVGVISDNTITLYTPYVFRSVNITVNSISFDPLIAGKFAIAYFKNSSPNYLSAVIGQISGTDITFGSNLDMENENISRVNISYFPNESNRFVIAYVGFETRAHYRICTVSGTTITSGSSVQLTSGTCEQIGLSHSKLSAGKFFIAYNDSSYSWDVQIKMLTSTSGTTANNDDTYNISMGSEAAAVDIDCDPFSSDKFVVTYRDWANSSRCYARVGTYSSTAITAMGSANLITTETIESSWVKFDPTGGNRLAIGGYIGSTFKIAGGVRSGDTLTMASPSTIFASNSECFQFAFTGVSAGKLVAAGTSLVAAGQIAASITNLSAAKIIGVAQESGTTGQTKKVALKGGVDSARTGLTPQTTYYVQSDGTVSTSSTSPAVKLGRALSSTALLLVGEQ